MVRQMARYAAVLTIALMCAAPNAGAQATDVFADIDRVFEEFQLDAHVPGLQPRNALNRGTISPSISKGNIYTGEAATAKREQKFVARSQKEIDPPAMRA